MGSEPIAPTTRRPREYGKLGVAVLEEQPTALQAAALAPLGLTRCEAEVLQWVAQGKTNMEIGTILGVSSRTVQKHLEHIYQKLGVETRMAAAMRALALATSQEP